jgi:TPP-dependent pyruvate/acetoin dehydrogenase alpha subunit
MIDKVFLEAFERDIASCYERGEIRAPVHLAGGNEDELIEIFKQIGPNDWVCSAWRTHLHCLLKGVPAEELKASILAGWSITLNYPKYHILTSAIAGGVISQAVGVADGMKTCGADTRVWCFLGDMTRYMGVYWESLQYAFGQDLPISFVVEDNGLSVCSPTLATWGKVPILGAVALVDAKAKPVLSEYKYKLSWPHQGIGRRVNF